MEETPTQIQIFPGEEQIKKILTYPNNTTDHFKISLSDLGILVNNGFLRFLDTVAGVMANRAFENGIANNNTIYTDLEKIFLIPRFSLTNLPIYIVKFNKMKYKDVITLQGFISAFIRCIIQRNFAGMNTVLNNF